MKKVFRVTFMNDDLDPRYIEADYLDPRGAFLGFCKKGDDPGPFLVYGSAAIFEVFEVTEGEN